MNVPSQEDRLFGRMYRSCLDEIHVDTPLSVAFVTCMYTVNHTHEMNDRHLHATEDEMRTRQNTV